MKVEEYWHGTIKNYRYDEDVSPLFPERRHGSLIVIAHQEIMAPQTSKIATASPDATDTSVAIMAITPKTRSSMLDSVALSPVSGKSHLKETIRGRPVWTAYSIAHVKFTATPINQPTTPTENVGCLNMPAS